MAEVDPKIILRMGSHSEKEYIEKLISQFDGIAVGANLVEATPGATASLLIKIAGKKKQIPFYFDPMTYAYGAYVDPQTGRVRNDLDWIKSDQKKKSKIVRDFKSSYRKLAEALGSPFNTAVTRNRAVRPEDFDDDLTNICRRVAAYQLRRLRDEIEKDQEYAMYADFLPQPSAVFAPYFYIEPSEEVAWRNLVLKLAAETARLNLGAPSHMVLCAPDHYLSNREFINWVATEVPRTGIKGVWLWFSKFDEYVASEEELRALRSLVERLSRDIEVYNMHGGFFSLALSKFGLSGISHGVGYGEQKDVVPVIGQSTPTVRYYLPALHRRLSVPQIELCFRRLAINTPSDFHEQICDCTICQGIVKKDLKEFSEFGERHFSTPKSKRMAQTPAAAKRCRFHFLLRRSQERSWVKESSKDEIRHQLRESIARWSKTQLGSNTNRLALWDSVLA